MSRQIFLSHEYDLLSTLDIILAKCLCLSSYWESCFSILICAIEEELVSYEFVLFVVLLKSFTDLDLGLLDLDINWEEELSHIIFLLVQVTVDDDLSCRCGSPTFDLDACTTL